MMMTWGRQAKPMSYESFNSCTREAPLDCLRRIPFMTLYTIPPPTACFYKSSMLHYHEIASVRRSVFANLKILLASPSIPVLKFPLMWSCRHSC